MTKKTETIIKKYRALTDMEKYDFLKSLDEMGGIETYTVGNQIDEFMRSMESDEETFQSLNVSQTLFDSKGMRSDYYENIN